MTFRTGILATANAIRMNVPKSLDLRQNNALSIVQRVWAGGVRDAAGGFTDTTLDLVERYRVRQVSTREIAGSGGVYENGDLRIGPITPSNGTIGYTAAQIAPTFVAAATELRYVLAGNHAGIYRRVSFENTSDVSWYLVLRRTNDSPNVA